MATSQQTSFSRSLSIQGRIVGALLIRETITRYGRHNIGFLWLFLEPMMFTLGVLTLWTATKSVHGSSMPIIPFAISGYSSVLLWRNAANRTANAIEPNKALLFHRNVRVLDVVTARILLEIIGATASITTLSMVMILGGWMDPPDDLLKVLMGWFLTAWFAAALALIVGAASERSEAVDRLWHTITYLLFPLSGAAYMVDWLPKNVQAWALLLPMVNGTELLRDGYFGHLVKTYYSISYLATCNLVMTMIGLAMVRDAARRVEGA